MTSSLFAPAADADRVAGSRTRSLVDWSLAPTAPDRFALPSDVRRADLHWCAATAPGTVAEALLAAGAWTIDRDENFDASDWWYRCGFEHVPAASQHLLRFRGLATLAEVWLNDHPILKADNMFREYSVDVTPLLSRHNDLVVCFRSLERELTRRRPRPRWKTRLVSHQQLRWFRTTLLGRIPGWSPPVAAVGPWRGVSLESRGNAALGDLDLQTTMDGDAGTISVACDVSAESDTQIDAELSVGNASATLQVDRRDGACRISGKLRVENVVRWWPHTHGTPHLYPCALTMVVNGQRRVHDCGAVGFRRIETRRDDGGFAIHVNGVPVFCRGACWTVNDIVSLRGDPAELSRVLTLMRQAGANMVRVGGTMIYEDDEFYRLCDELGILVWQDFMFANMDYPAEDGTFLSSVTSEVTQQLRRLSRHPSVSVYCGNSEVEQQAAMLGVAAEAWRSPLFSHVLPDLCHRWHPDTPYVPSTPSGGAMPFHVGTGIAHYYGVGAYRRPLSDVRRASVRFAAECLGFANVPEPALVDVVMRGDMPATHHPRWKQRIPRDSGAGWDFEDVRDHYLGDVFSLDPGRLRAVDPEQYLELGRVTTGEVMSRVFSEWRCGHSRCQGGLVWFLKDLWPGAGWGVLDSGGMPKACFYYLRRAWQPQAIALTDEGLDGVHVHVVNESDRSLSATVELTVLRDGHVVTAHGSTTCPLGPRAQATFGSDELLGAFYDASYAYRFGPPTHDVVAATLSAPNGEAIGEAFFFPRSGEPARHASSTVHLEGRALDDDAYEVTLSSERFMYAAHFAVNGFLPDDNYFHLLPGRTKTVRFEPIADTPAEFNGYLKALSLDAAVPVKVTA